MIIIIMFLVYHNRYDCDHYGCFVIGIYSDEQNFLKSVASYIKRTLKEYKPKKEHKKYKTELLRLISERKLEEGQIIVSECLLQGWIKILPINLNEEIKYDIDASYFDPTNSYDVKLEDLNLYL